MKTAIVLGATGLTGGTLVRRLLEEEEYERVRLYSRSSIGISHPKLEEHLVNVLDLSEVGNAFQGDVVFCCVGTTWKKTPDKRRYREIDQGIPVQAANLCKKNGISEFLVISSMGADENSRFLYNRIKGEMEREVLHVGLSGTYIFRPSLINGPRKESRFIEKWGKFLISGLDPFLIGPFKKYRSISPKSISEALVRVARHGYDKKIIESDAIRRIAAE